MHLQVNATFSMGFAKLGTGWKSFKRKFKEIKEIIYAAVPEIEASSSQTVEGTIAPEKTLRLERTRPAARWRLARPARLARPRRPPRQEQSSCTSYVLRRTSTMYVPSQSLSVLKSHFTLARSFVLNSCIVFCERRFVRTFDL